MGANKNMKLEAKDAQRRRRSPLPATGEADWGSANLELLHEAVKLVSKSGGAIRFGYTRDMGAYAVGIYENGLLNTEYVRPSEDINEYLRGVIADFRD